MKIKLKVCLLLVLVLAAAVSARGAWKSLQVRRVEEAPMDVYSRLRDENEDPSYYLGESGGYVAVYEDKHGKKPVKVTGIELSVLRQADVAMLELGIPVTDVQSLLMLLEDLGS